MASNTINTFIDFNALSAQSSNQKYGPIDDENFRVSSVFTLASDSMAYAVVDGTVLVQPQIGSSDLVNVIIKPRNVQFQEIPTVKYFIYRGLRKDNFLNGTSLASPSASDFINTIWVDYNNANTSGVPSPKRVGYDTFGNSDTYDLDKIFVETRLDPDNDSLPVVLSTIKQGETIGKFKQGKICFEIVIEDRGSILTLGDVRKDENIIVVTSPSSTDYNLLSINERSSREKILTFIDSAAFYGLFGADDFSVINSPNQTESGWSDVYNSILIKFQTKNTVYLDIRNEYGYSINYGKDNEGNSTHPDRGNHFQLGINITPSPQIYYQNLWPIYIIDNINTTGNNWLRYNLSFWRTYNPVPVIYGDYVWVLYDGTPQQVLSGEKFWADTTYDSISDRYNPSTIVTNHWSEIYSCASPGVNGHSYAFYIKIYDNRRYVPSNVPPSAFKKDHYLDNIFGPIVDVNNLKKINAIYPTQWHTGLGKRYVNMRATAIDDPFTSEDNLREYMVDMGVSISNDKILFYGRIKEFNYLYSTTTISLPPNLDTNSINSGVSSSPSLIEIRKTNSTDDGNMKIDVPQNYLYDTLPPSDSTPTNVIISTTSMQGEPPSPAEFSILYTISEYVDSLLSVAETFDNNIHDVYINIDELHDDPFISTNGKPYLYINNGLTKLSGYDNLGNYQVKNPLGSGILEVFSQTGDIFTSRNSLNDSSLGYKHVEDRPNALILVDDFISYVIEVEEKFADWDAGGDFNSTTSAQKTSTRIRVHSYGKSARREKFSDEFVQGALQDAVPDAAYDTDDFIPEVGSVVRNLDQWSRSEVPNWKDIYTQLTSHADENLIMDNPSPYIRVPKPGNTSEVESVDMGQVLYGFESLVTPSIAHRSVGKQYVWNFDINDPYDLTAIVANIATPIAQVLSENTTVPRRGKTDVQKELLSTDPDVFVRLDHYYLISAPDADILGNVDAVGLRYAYQKLNVTNPDLSDVLKLYYKNDSGQNLLNPQPVYYNVNNRWLIFCLFMNLVTVNNGIIHWQPGISGSVWETGGTSDPLSFNKASLELRIRNFTLFWMNRIINVLTTGKSLVTYLPSFIFKIRDFNSETQAYPNNQTEAQFYPVLRDYVIDKFLNYIKAKLIGEQGSIQ